MRDTFDSENGILRRPIVDQIDLSQPSSVFGPDEIRVMRTAFDKSWAALAFASWRDDFDMRATRERLARSIVRTAARGERRVGTLTDKALGCLEPRSAR